MKLNIANVETGAQKIYDIQDEIKCRVFYDKRISDIVPGDTISDEFKGYKFKITGGNDKQGFPMQQGILTANRVRRLLKAGDSCYRPRRTGERRRKSVRGCIVSSEISVLSLIIAVKGEQELPGVTDVIIPQRRMPKRSTKLITYLTTIEESHGIEDPIITQSNLFSKLPMREIPGKEGKKPRYKCVKVQRLLTKKLMMARQDREKYKMKRIQASVDAAKAYREALSLRKETVA